MMCPKCGAACPDDATFCPTCSANLQNNEGNIDANAMQMPAPNIPNPGMNQMPNPGMPQMAAPEMNQMPNPGMPQMAAPEMNQMPNPGMPQMATPEMNQMQNPGMNPMGNVPQNEVPPVKEKKPFPVKLVVIIGTGVLLLAAAIIIVLTVFAKPRKPGEDKEKLNAVFGVNTPIPILENGKYGYIDTSGKKIITPQFTSAGSFHGDYALVCGDAESSYHCFIIDDKGKKVLDVESEYDVEYDKEGSYWNIGGVLYDSKLKQMSPTGLKVKDVVEGYAYVYESDKTVGLLNLNGKVIYSYDKGGNSYVYFSIDCGSVDDVFTDTYCRVNIDNEKYGVINIRTGKMIIDYLDHFIFSEGYNKFKEAKSDYSLIKRMYIQDDKIMYETDSTEVSLSHYKGYPYVEIYDSRKSYGERYSYIDVKTGLITSEEPPVEKSPEKGDVWEEYTTYTKFSCNNGNGVMAGDKVLIKCEWPTLKTLDLELYKFLDSNGKKLIYATKDDKFYVLDLSNGQTLATFNATSIKSYEGSTFITYNEGESTFVYNLLTGKSISVSSDTTVTVGPNYVKVDMGREKDYYNVNLEVIYTESKVSTVS